MKILVISQYFYPERFRINDVVVELSKRGHKITVLTGLPNYPMGKIYQGYENAYKEVEDYYGITVHRCKLRPRRSGSINLALNYISFIRQAKKTLRSINPDFDVIYFYEPSPISSGIPAIWFGKKNKIKTVIYNLDIWPDCVRDSQNGKIMSKKNPVFLFAKAISKYVYSRFDLILNKCDDFGKYLERELHISADKMISLFEHAEDTYLSVNCEPLNNGIIDFMFLGNMGKAQNCSQIIKAFSQIDHKNAKLHFVGDGSYVTQLKDLAAQLELGDSVIFHGIKSVEETISFYNFADVCLLTLSNDTASGLTPPTKLPGYMAACRPIVASINGVSQEIIKDANCGFYCDAGDLDGLTNIMAKIVETPDCLKNLGKNGRAYFLNHFTLDMHIDSLEKILITYFNTI